LNDILIANRTFVRNITFIARRTRAPSTIQSSHVFISKIIIS